MADDQIQQPQAKRPKTLIGMLGVTAALGAMTLIPKEESGRTVVATATPSGHVALKPVSGRQYLDAYEDIVGVWTACDGIAGVKPGSHFTEAQCDAMLEAKLADEADHVMRCTPGLDGPGHDNERIAAVLLAHNIGWPRYCRSSVAKLANARAYRAAASRFPLYDVAGGRHVPGLHARRLREQAIWMKDVR